MPPWFADPRYGKFSNDPSLSPQQIATIADWVDAGAPAGSAERCATSAALGRRLEHSDRPTKSCRCRMPVKLPAHGDVEYTYEIVPTGFTADKWVQMSEIRPSSPRARASRRGLHPAAGLEVAARAPVGVPFTPSSFADPEERAEAHADDQRHAAGLRSGQRARSLARRHGEVHSRRLRPGLPDALHHQRPGRPPTRPASGWSSPSSRRSSAC